MVSRLHCGNCTGQVGADRQEHVSRKKLKEFQEPVPPRQRRRILLVQPLAKIGQLQAGCCRFCLITVLQALAAR